MPLHPACMRLIFVFEMFQIKWRFQKRIKNLKKVFSFLDNCIWISSGQFSLLKRKYFSSNVNLLTSGLKVSDITKKNFFQRKFSKSNDQSW